MYAVIAKGMGASDPAAVGDKGLITKVGDLPFFDVLFQRCHAVAHIRMTGRDVDTIAAYAKRLDSRLKAAIC